MKNLGNPAKSARDFDSDVAEAPSIHSPIRKFAPVGPYQLYQQFQVHEYKPATILLLAHDVVEYKKEYQETFSDPFWNDTNIIMDNSLVELGGAVDALMVHEAAEIVSADIVVLPDAMGDGQATVALIEEALDRGWLYKFREYKSMPLIHGRDFQEWLYCASRVSSYLFQQIEWVGIPRITEGLQETRNGAIYHRSDLVEIANRVFFPGKNIHLFGFSDYVMEDLRAAVPYCVKSIDSAVPLRFKTDRPEELLFMDPGKRDPEWFKTARFEKWMLNNCDFIDKTIRGLRTS